MPDTLHMTVAYGAQPRLLTTGLNINDLNEEGRQKALQNLKEGFDEAYEIGATGFTFLSGKYEEAKKEESYKSLIKSAKEICAYVKRFFLRDFLKMSIKSGRVELPLLLSVGIVLLA
jgi:sugar phosphate isomerase/epimerase